MPRITPRQAENTSSRSQDILDAVQRKLGMTPNLLRTMAHSPAALSAYVGFGQALGSASLAPQLREQIALTVAQANDCDYCLSAHSAAGQALGLSPDELQDARVGAAPDRKIDAALRFARELVELRGRVRDETLSAVRAEGFTEGEIAELIAVVAHNIYSNYFNHVANPEVDFPAAPELVAR